MPSNTVEQTVVSSGDPPYKQLVCNLVIPDPPAGTTFSETRITVKFGLGESGCNFQWKICDLTQNKPIGDVAYFSGYYPSKPPLPQQGYSEGIVSGSWNYPPNKQQNPYINWDHTRLGSTIVPQPEFYMPDNHCGDTIQASLDCFNCLVISRDEGKSTGNNGNNTLNDLNKNWNVNQWLNHGVYIFEGTGKGQFRMITSNTATQLTVSENWTTIPDATSQYRIQSVQNNVYLAIYMKIETIGV